MRCGRSKNKLSLRIQGTRGRRRFGGMAGHLTIDDEVVTLLGRLYT